MAKTTRSKKAAVVADKPEADQPVVESQHPAKPAPVAPAPAAAPVSPAPAELFAPPAPAPDPAPPRPVVHAPIAGAPKPLPPAPIAPPPADDRPPQQPDVRPAPPSHNYNYSGTGEDVGSFDAETNAKYEAVKGGKLYIKDLQQMEAHQLQEIAKTEGIPDYVGMKKQDLIFQILRARIRQNGLMYGEGVLEILPDGFGFLR